MSLVRVLSEIKLLGGDEARSDSVYGGMLRWGEQDQDAPSVPGEAWWAVGDWFTRLPWAQPIHQHQWPSPLQYNTQFKYIFHYFEIGI